MTKIQRSLQCLALAGLALAFAGAAFAAPAPPPCNVPSNPMGTVTLPPAGCQYLSPSQVHLIINGLPAGTTIMLAPIHLNFICRQSAPTGPCNVSGGPLGGEVENFTSTAVFQVTGTGSLSGLNRTISVPLNVQVATAPRTAGASVQTFATNMEILQGGITGDPDFATLQIVGGTANGFSSPGSTTLTRQTNGTFNVSSTFNVGYSIKFAGASGSKLAGLSGVTEGTVKMQAQGGGGVQPAGQP